MNLYREVAKKRSVGRIGGDNLATAVANRRLILADNAFDRPARLRVDRRDDVEKSHACYLTGRRATAIMDFASAGMRPTRRQSTISCPAVESSFPSVLIEKNLMCMCSSSAVK